MAAGDADARLFAQSELPLTFGLGKATRVEELTVQWPDGTSQRVDPPALNRLVTITEPP